MSYTFIYFFTRLDSFNSLIKNLIFISFLSIIGLIIFFFLEQDSYVDGEIKNIYSPKIIVWIKKIAVLLILCTIFSVTIPTTKEAAVIYLLPKVIKNEQCQQIPTNFVKFLNLKMEKWLNEQIGEEKR